MESRIYTTIIIAASMVCGCQKSADAPGVFPVSFMASVQEMASGEADQTKGTLWNETGTDKPLSDYTNTFSISAWNNSNGSSAIPTGTAVSYSDDEWKTAKKYYWVENVRKTVFAYANLPESGSSVQCSSEEGLKLSYSVPGTASGQTDILLGAYDGVSDKGSVNLQFIHPLTSVRFKAGTLADDAKVEKLSIVDVAGSGAVTLYPAGPAGTLSDWEVSDYDHSVTQSKEGGLGTDAIGEPFLLIPQDLAAHPVKVVLELSDESVVTNHLSTGKWESGVAYTYTIDYDNPE